ncbi:MAG: hypothetical protein LBM28_05205 [Oscillospiraceae bacterium]|nr:hypothetical protein [Oscillospiraceae bacterium]
MVVLSAKDEALLTQGENDKVKTTKKSSFGAAWIRLSYAYIIPHYPPFRKSAPRKRRGKSGK